MKKVLLALLLTSNLIASSANAAVFLAAFPGLWAALGGTALVVTATHDEEDHGIASTFWYRDNQLKQISAWPETYTKGDGLYGPTFEDLQEFRQVMLDQFQAETVVNQNQTLNQLLKYGDELREISLADFTYENHGSKTLAELLGKDQINPKTTAQLAIALVSMCRFTDNCLKANSAE